jgi:uncharacterized LabA/DUF88 family protein
MERVCVYIDGFNLYFGIIDRGWRRYLWLDLVSLAQRLMKPGQSLISTNYFTAPIRADPQKAQRQSTFLQALEARGGINIHYGRYQQKKKQCFQCQSTWYEYEEKMTDVRLATMLVRDAYRDEFDACLIISADADLQPPIKIIKNDFPVKRVIVAFPPKRDSYHLRGKVDEHFRIGRGRISKSQLPAKVKKADGYILSRPPDW